MAWQSSGQVAPHRRRRRPDPHLPTAPQAQGSPSPVGTVPLGARHPYGEYRSRRNAGLDWIARGWGYGVAAVLGGVVMLAAGAVAALSSIVAKWVLVGTIRAGEHPLWSSFIWRNEVVDTFIEMVSAPWFARSAAGTPALVWWLRGLGAKIDAERGVKATGCPRLTS